MTQLEAHEPLQDISLPEPGTMTLEEFLENDVEGYEYVEGQLVRMAAASRRHGEVNINISEALPTSKDVGFLKKIRLPTDGQTAFYRSLATPEA
jgi:hypothetical protein